MEEKGCSMLSLRFHCVLATQSCEIDEVSSQNLYYIAHLIDGYACIKNGLRLSDKYQKPMNCLIHKGLDGVYWLAIFRPNFLLISDFLPPTFFGV